jgi:hypothetical protein
LLKRLFLIVVDSFGRKSVKRIEMEKIVEERR